MYETLGNVNVFLNAVSLCNPWRSLSNHGGSQLMHDTFSTRHSSNSSSHVHYLQIRYVESGKLSFDRRLSRRVEKTLIYKPLPYFPVYTCQHASLIPGKQVFMYCIDLQRRLLIHQCLPKTVCSVMDFLSFSHRIDFPNSYRC